MLPYVFPDPVLQKKLEAVGCAAVMPLASPIGSGRGLKLRHAIEIMIEQAEVPVVVDAGLGSPSQAAEAMELGADAVLVNTAIARPTTPPRWRGVRGSRVEAGRAARRAGLIEERDTARPSSPIAGLVDVVRRAPSTATELRSSSRVRPSPSLLDRARPGCAVRAGRAERRAGRARPLRRNRAGGRRPARRRPARRWWIAASTSSPRARRTSPAFLEAAVRGGVDIVQIREKDAARRASCSPAEAGARDHPSLGVPLVVNDRPDLARARRGRLVHVGQDDLPVAAARTLRVGGRPVHARARGARRDRGRLRRRRPGLRDADEGGPARASVSSYVRYAAEHARLPWFAIGGIDESNVAEVVAAGARGSPSCARSATRRIRSAPRPRSARALP